MRENPGVHKIALHQPKKSFAIIPNQAVRDPRISANAFRLLAYLLSHNDGYELTYRQIETETGLGRYAINAASKQLGDLGWLRVEQTKLTNGQFGPKSWTLLSPGANESTAGEPVAGESAPDGFHSGTANGLKKTISREDNLLEKTTRENTTGTPPTFDEFWSLYPKKADKRTARRAWDKAIKRASVDEIVAGAIRYANDPNREYRFTKNPATWLNADAWENGPEPSREEPRKLSNAEKAARLAMELEVRSVPREVEQAPEVLEVETTSFDWIGRDPNE